MDRLTFEQLCRDASLALGLDDTSELGQGYTVSFNDVLFEFLFAEGLPSCLILAEVGAAAPEHRADVYENLLTLQLMSWTQPALRFGFNPARQAVQLCVAAGLPEKADGAWLANLLSTIATQVTEWRTTLLAGKLQPPAGFEAFLASTTHPSRTGCRLEGASWSPQSHRHRRRRPWTRTGLPDPTPGPRPTPKARNLRPS